MCGRPVFGDVGRPAAIGWRIIDDHRSSLVSRADPNDGVKDRDVLKSCCYHDEGMPNSVLKAQSIPQMKYDAP
jgi:hypothetical protein